MTFEFRDEVGGRDVGGQVGESFGEVNFLSDDGVQPVFDDGPDAGEDPRCFVDETDSEGFGVVRFETFNHEFDGAVIL